MEFFFPYHQNPNPNYPVDEFSPPPPPSFPNPAAAPEFHLPDFPFPAGAGDHEYNNNNNISTSNYYVDNHSPDPQSCFATATVNSHSHSAVQIGAGGSWNSVGNEAGDNQQESRRRSNCGKQQIRKKGSEAAMAHNKRVAFRTKSELEAMDDGFKWRKYGKKSVKNTPFPRHYYKCSSVGCRVKKRVERESEDSRFVITTYEGLHSHESPSSSSYNQHHVYYPSSSSSPPST